MQILHEWSLGKSRAGVLASGFRAEGDAGVELVQMCLKSFLAVFRKTGKFDSHANAGITGTYNCTGRDALFSDPQIDTQSGPDCQRHDCLNITTAAADIRGVHAQWGIHTFIAEF